MDIKEHQKYRLFSFPNSYSDLELYHFYLKEFDVIHNEISPEKIEEIFTALASDYIISSINENTFSSIVSTMYFSGDTPKKLDKFNPSLSWLMDFVCELHWDKENNKARHDQTIKNVKMFVKDKNRFREYSEDKKLI